MSKIEMKTLDEISPELGKLAKALRNMRPAMKRIEREVFVPMVVTSWLRGGLRSRTGELRKSITPWSGKTSAGVSVRTKRGRDLVLPKAFTFLEGRRAKQFKKKDTYKVKRGGTTFDRKNAGSPWGAIPRRPFFPESADLRGKTDRIKNIIAAFLREVSEKS